MAAQDVPTPDRPDLTAGLTQFLSQHGDLCLGKFDWPIDVDIQAFAQKTRDAVQMPVLEQLGLVKSSDGTIPMHREDGGTDNMPAKRYELTDEGKKYYLVRETRLRRSDGQEIVHQGDLCAGHFRLDKITSWDSPTMVHGQPETLVSYTYKFSPAPWARRPEALKVFPMVNQIIKGEGTLNLKQRMRWSDSHWIEVSGAID